MTTTLTIQVRADLLERAEQLARARGMTVSDMLGRLLRIITMPPRPRNELPPITRSALGMLPPLSGDEVDRIIDDERMRKYGKP